MTTMMGPRYNRGPGLFGVCQAYYAMVEEQGRGTLHCHILLWLEGNLNPERLRSKMITSPSFQRDMFTWLESLIKCELPRTSTVCPSETEKPSGDDEMDDCDPRIERPPKIDEFDEETFAREFDSFVERVVMKCNWHEHTSTCFKYLKRGEQGGDHNCRMRIDGSVRAETFLDPETQSIMLRRWHPRINNYNPIVSFLLQCNMDIKYIGLGPAAKALVYYISDYITKSELKVNVGLEALRTALRSHESRFEGDHSSTSQFREKNLLTKSEISHQRVMSYLIGGGDYYTAHDFETVRFHDFLNVIDHFEDEECPECRCGCVDKDMCITFLCGATCTATVQTGSVMVSNDCLDYLLRPQRICFEHMCLWEFTCRLSQQRWNAL
ncbi:hypothetical protein EDD15DRAFT_2385661 [Pisolithus albus]|nr:hypothetical protein EDD15DRAFT_2385661 [Pisolithus albus]